MSLYETPAVIRNGVILTSQLVARTETRAIVLVKGERMIFDTRTGQDLSGSPARLGELSREVLQRGPSVPFVPRFRGEKPPVDPARSQAMKEAWKRRRMRLYAEGEA